MTGGVSEIQQTALGQEDHRMPVREHPLINLGLDADLGDARILDSPAMSISLSKWPMFPTIA